MTKYRPEIDGLRTIAVVVVIIFHLNSNFLIGGYYGVDVFFCNFRICNNKYFNKRH